MLRNILVKFIQLLHFDYAIKECLMLLEDSEMKLSLKKCGNNVSLRKPLVIENPQFVEIGNNVSFASFVHIWGRGGVKIENNTMIASHVAITSAGHDYGKKEMHKTGIYEKTEIGKNVWIGSHSIILPGVRIGDGAVIGANTLVKEDVPSNAIFVGTPGKVIRFREKI